jgi:uncharacterized protein YndB with AHSA1/START domain
MKRFLIGLGVLVLLALLCLLIGAFLPERHSATCSAVYRQSPQAVWDAITRYEEFPSWRRDLESVRGEPGPDGALGWVETASFGELPLVVTESVQGQRLVTEISDDSLPFGGTWTYELAADPSGGTRLTITEDGLIRSAFFRFVARFLIGVTSTMEDYLVDLGRRFGEDVTPRVH